MSNHLQKGDKIAWRDEKGEEQEGKIIRLLTEDAMISGEKYMATVEKPMFVVQAHESHQELVKSPDEVTHVGHEHRRVKE